jgi:hypothetical protein
MKGEDVASKLLDDSGFKEEMLAVRVRSVLADLSAIEPEPELHTEVNWSYALRCASALASADTEAAQDAALRIAQSCLSAGVGEQLEHGHFVASALVLEWLGNRRALMLADQRDLVSEEAWREAPPPMRLDVIQRRLELVVPGTGDESLPVNPFQRGFWSAAEDAQWVSVSAPTSAGKSFIVRQWFEKRITESKNFRGVYIVPTRALLDEVSKALELAFGPDIPVFTIPWDSQIGQAPKEIYVLTQERFHLLQDFLKEFSADVLFVDEAQKLSDGERGVLLQRVITEEVRRNSDTQVIYASALAENPDLLLEGRPTDVTGQALRSEVVTVNQNLLWVDEIQGQTKRFSVSLLVDGEAVKLGELPLPARPTSQSKRLSLVAYSLGREHAGNLVYVNFASEAETTALQLKEARRTEVDLSDNPRVIALKELIEKTIHPKYRLNDVLDTGIAFHYGNMPLLVRSEIESLFRDGILSYLVCTSTLLEGVNLPCSNLFVRGPKKGRDRFMAPADFWNLAGRAGRWGIEFQGNIVCVDATDQHRWPEPPRVRVAQPLRRATDAVLKDLPRLQAYIAGEGIDQSEAEEEVLPVEPVFNLLASRLANGESLKELPGMDKLTSAELSGLEKQIEETLEPIAIDQDLYQRHTAISPVAMQTLFEYFEQHPEPERLPLSPPENTNAADSYVAALSRVSKFLGAPFGVHSGYQFALAILMRDWMRGRPLAVLIKSRIEYERKRNPKGSQDTLVAAAIRNTMRDVEQFARFEAPKYLSCYVDVLEQFIEISKIDVELPEIDLQMMLEMGVSRPTELSMMTLGLSRTSAVALERYILEDELTREECLRWLMEADLGTFDLPALVVDEIEAVLSAARRRAET